MGFLLFISKLKKGFLRQRGVAALVFVVVIGMTAAALLVGVVYTLTKTIAQERIGTRAQEALAVAEGGAEEVVLRIRRGEIVPSPLTVAIGSGTATVTNSTSGTVTTIISTSDVSGAKRAVEIKVNKNTTDVQFFYGVQVDDGGMSMANASSVIGNIYSNGNIVGSGGQVPAITGSATVAGGIPANPQDQWTTQDGNQNFATANSNEDIAQSFTATAAGAVPQVSVYLAKVGNPNKDITLRFHADNGGKPATSTLTSATIYRTSVGASPSWIDTAFALPVNVTNNTKYWIVLDYQGNDSNNYWVWRKDNTNGYANNNGKYTSNCCSGNPTWTNIPGTPPATSADLAFKVWIGGATTRIEGVTIGDASSGDGYANLFDNVTIRGSACPNAYCHVENPARENLPISDGVIQDWRDAAEDGGTCGPPTCDALGNYELDSNKGKPIGSLGPIKVPGNLTVTNLATLTVTGTIWVQGIIDFSNNCNVQLASSYGSNSGVILTDSTATVNPGCSFAGSGTPGSYPMLISAKNDISNTVIQIDNVSTGMVYYGAHGRLYLKQNSSAREATAYGMTLENGASVSYESGLANVHFTSGPGGGYTTISWKEIIPP